MTDKGLTLQELQRTLEYQRLTKKQRLWVSTYCAGGSADGEYDAIAATIQAYPCKNQEVARVMSYAIMANIKIIAVLNLYFGKSPTEQFLVMLDRAINNKKLTIAQVQALKMKCEILGLSNKLPTNLTELATAQQEERADRRREAKKKKQESKPAPRAAHVKLF